MSKFKIGDKVIQKGKDELPREGLGNYSKYFEGKIFIVRTVEPCVTSLTCSARGFNYSGQILTFITDPPLYSGGICSCRFRKLYNWIKL